LTICPSNTSLRLGSLRASPIILVVEDEVLVRLWVTDELRGNGFTVLEATNGDEALQVLNSSEEVDLVFTDIRMPGRRDGVALAQWLRKERPGLKVIIASSNLGASGADAFVAKPYSVPTVVQIIRELLGLQGTQSSPES
jgi:two-component system, response regulator PdtaR